MAISMTGFGRAQTECAGHQIAVEIKSVNGRFLKVTCKLPSSLQTHESAVEQQVRARLARGSVTVHVRLTRAASATPVRINEAAVRAYQETFARLGLCADAIATLPGVLQADEEGPSVADAGAALGAAVAAALDALEGMRQAEGTALVHVLRGLCDRIEGLLDHVRLRAPVVVREYQSKLHERLRHLLADASASIDPSFLAREVAVFADRCDITEEIDRLKTHLEQVRNKLSLADECGRTLDFLSQEMHREVNTMGSKSADAALSLCIVDLKADVERFKEQAANIE